MNKHSFTKTKTHVAVRNMIAAGLFAAAVMPVQAKDFQIGDFDLSVNSTVSIGKSFRVENRDRALYGTNNVDSKGTPGTGGSNTSDDGNLNYDKGDAFSTIIKGVHDFDLKKDNYGFFGRVKWFYDQTLADGDVFHGHEPTNNNRGAPPTFTRTPQPLDDSGFHPYARADGIDLLDAFGYWNTNIGEMPVDLRLGKQVISWGESLFIFSPISGLNTLDVSALRRPGAELKEGFTPSEMLYMNLGVTDSTSLEAFYQLKWRKTVPEGCGTYFSTNDFAPDGCDRLAFAGSLGPFPDGVQLQPGFGPPNAQGGFANPTPFFFTPVNRSVDRQPDDGGQFGLALRSYVSEVDTEFGAYYLNYHNRLPLISLQKGVGAYALSAAGTTGTYFVDYPEDISVLGLSFATNVAGWSWSGELSRAQDVPMQINANDLLIASLAGAAANPGGPVATALGAGATGLGSTTLNNRLQNAPNGSIVNGYDQFDVTQIQTNAIKTFDRALGSSQVVVVGEVGAVYVSGLPEQTDIRYGRNPVFGSFNGNLGGYVTDFSWGYRLRAAATYRDVFLGTDLIPTISWSHDVEGWSPEPGQAFNEGRQSVGLALGFEFDANTKASVSYTTFTNAADFDPLRDRDFVSFTASYSF